MSTTTHASDAPTPDRSTEPDPLRQPDQPDRPDRPGPRPDGWSSAEGAREDLLRAAVEVGRGRRGSGAVPPDQVEELITGYFRHVPADDLAGRTDVDLYGTLARHVALARRRPAGTALVRVETPDPAEQGWGAAGHTVVQVVVDDMPFLVDSLTMELGRQWRDVHLVIHPLLDVVRDADGVLQQVHAVPDESREPAPGAVRESWMHLEIDRVPAGGPEDPGAPGSVESIAADLERVLDDVRAAVTDWDAMHARAREIAADLLAAAPGTTTGTAPLPGTIPGTIPVEEARQTAELLTWLAEGHFTFLGARDYTLERVAPEGDPGAEGAAAEDVLRPVAGSGLGILRERGAGSPGGTGTGTGPVSASFARLPEPVRARAREPRLLVLAKANSRATVHRPAYLDHVGIKTFDAAGEVTGERRFLGLFSSAAYTESLLRIPVLREKVAAVLHRSGFDPQGHAGKALLDTLETYPRDDLFHTPVEELAPLAEAAMQARERRRLRVFARADTYGRYVSVLVYLPRDRYNTAVRERFSRILAEALQAESVEFNVRIDESTTARVHFVVRLPRGRALPEVDTADLERRLAEASRSWRDDLLAAVVADHGEQVGSRLARRYLDAFPEAYKEDFGPRTASADLARLEALVQSGDGPDGTGADGTGAGTGGTPGTDRSGRVDLALYQDVDAGPGEARLKIYRIGPALSLSTILPVLSSLGVEVVDERPYELLPAGDAADGCWIYDFGLRYPGVLPARARDLFQDTVRALLSGAAEVDGFNAVVLRAQVTWREATVLRAYARYMRQGGSLFSQESIIDALVSNVDLTRLLVQAFARRFDPDRPGDAEARARSEAEVEERIRAALDDVVSLDHDRILRSYLTHVRATLRTNYYQRDAAGRPHDYLSLKVEPSAIPELPAPRPRFEIFVYSPRVEGVHLRFGSVARGGLRWSDRRDDFRTEVLGLVKAQMVKNSVIVPVGAKGGFYAKDLPDPTDRDAWLAEGVACYRTFIRGLLDVTDNLHDGVTVPPERVVRHDGDDSYLVVAADKGTATFSDIANDVAREYGFWLGDAFASGGSVGYDHKAMGITARGAWVSVRRHFREMGIDCQREDVTVVGVGDMSGDVFGNGMLLSEHLRLVAAFDHRHVFLDPDPDAATSFAERQRLFALPRSSWQDYDPSLISAGGGVWPRSAKSIPISPQVRVALGLEEDVPDRLTPTELMRAILLAPVDLLWNGGIGTYVKASGETHLEVGDKSNDGLRVDGADVRARCIGEGGNLGVTQRGRIEYAAAGGRINTDFIDNSAGVDTSDHEVNLKILLDRVVLGGDLTLKQRNALLARMTDEVADLVLRDNEEQNLALANAVHNAPGLLHVHEAWMRALEKRGVIDRALEALPTSKEVARRQEQGLGLTPPELAVLLCWTKIVLAEELLDSDVPEDPYLDIDLQAYFPRPVQEGFAEQVRAHPLRREIIVTQVVNDLVNGAGLTYWPRLAGETGASAAELTRANFVAREIFGSLELREQVRALDNRIDAGVQTRMRLEMRTLVERGSRWLLTTRRPPLDSAALVARFREPVLAAMAQLPTLLVGTEAADWEERRAALVADGVPEDLASRVAGLPPAYALLNVVDVALREEREVEEVAAVHFALGDRLGLPMLAGRILALPRADRWQTMARATLRDDLHSVHAALTSQVLAATDAALPAGERVAAWELQQGEALERATGTLGDICSDEVTDLARMEVGLRVVRSLLA
ncbi:NAD-glutamate dehydrogenase [Nocardioides sp.]|uniref:NAD-glutamate dehydrogenase n=1 Tax=Nocardioides sp. TaxID=35761 RepID=UPI0035116066